MYLCIMKNGLDDSKILEQIREKVNTGERITDEEGLILFEKASLGFVGSLANQVKEKLQGDKVFFNRNFHIEPTNVCVFSCNFCSYSRLYAKRDEGWELSEEQMLDMVKKYDGKPITEVHIVGGVHPKLNLEFFANLMRKIKAHRPDLRCLRPQVRGGGRPDPQVRRHLGQEDRLQDEADSLGPDHEGRQDVRRHRVPERAVRHGVPRGPHGHRGRPRQDAGDGVRQSAADGGPHVAVRQPGARRPPDAGPGGPGDVARAEERILDRAVPDPQLQGHQG